MKQLFITSSTSYPTAAANYAAVASGQVAVFENGTLASAALGKQGYASVVVGRGTNLLPLAMDEVDLATLNVTKTSYVAAKTFVATITIPATVVDKDYTIVIAKKGVQFNERQRWTATERAKVTTAATMATALAADINANTASHGLKATVSTATITLTAQTAGEDYAILTDGALSTVKASVTTKGEKAIADKAWVADLAQQCAAGKGFNYLNEEGPAAHTIYPGFPEAVAAANYVVYNLRFANPRRGGKTRDEVVSQYLHIAVPSTATNVISKLDTLFGLASA